MSGILTVFHPDGRPVDPTLVEGLVQAMAYRGPDAQDSRLLGDIGLGHTMLRTTVESDVEVQPLCLDGVWICADARVDARSEVCRELSAIGPQVPLSTPDPELILRAYLRWGPACTNHLLGDFVFVIWDAHRRRLFCARDHFGVKPLFYAHLGQSLIIANTLDIVRLHPEVSDTLDELAIADFLLFPFEQDPDITDFADIRQLPAAHTLTWEQGRLVVERYWDLPVEETLRYRDDQEYIENFNLIFGQAVSDRLRSPRVAVNMSGGLDSTAVAAAARRARLEGGQACEVKAFTGVADSPLPDEERVWAQMVADHLGIEIHFTQAEDYPSGFEEPSVASLTGETAEGRPRKSMSEAHLEAITEHARTVLTGFGGDPVNRGSSSFYFDQLKELQVLSLFGDIRKTLAEGKRPPLQVRTLWRHWKTKRRLLRSYPEWLDRDFEKRLELRSRWRRIHSQLRIGWSSREEIVDRYWPHMFSNQDPGVTRMPVEYRHPFFDLRLVRFMVRVPTLPWFLGKVLLRKAMKGMLPDAILTRPKAFGGANLDDIELSRRNREWWAAKLARGPEIERFVDRARFLDAVDLLSRRGAADFDQLIRPISLASWLQHESRRQAPEAHAGR